MKRGIIALFALLMLANFASAIQVEDLQTGIVESHDEIIELKAQLSASIAQLEAKIDTLATQEETIDLLQKHLDVTNQIMENFRSALIVSFIVIGISLLGLGFSIFLFLKGKRRL